MIDPNSPDPSRKRSFFDDEEIHDPREASIRENDPRGQDPHEYGNRGERRTEQPMRSNNPYSNGRERMASRYHEEEEEEDYDDDYDRRSRSHFAFMHGLFHGDSSTRRLAFAAAGIGGILLLFIGGWMMTHTGHQGIPVIEPPQLAAKEKPAPDANTTTIGMDKSDGQMDADGKPMLAPAPEQANPAALAAQYGANNATANPSTIQPPPIMANTGNGTPNQAGNNKVVSNNPTSAPTVSSDNVTSSASKETEQSQQNNAATTADNGKAETSEEASPSAPSPARVSKPVHHKPVAKKTEISKSEEKSSKNSGGHYMVQLAALGSSSAAQKQWLVMRKKAPELLGKHSPSIQKAEIKGNAIYRVRIKGFASKVQASNFCNQLKAKHLSCTLANF